MALAVVLLCREASNKIKDQVTSRLMNLDSQRFSVIASWLMSECPESVAEVLFKLSCNSRQVVDLSSI